MPMGEIAPAESGGGWPALRARRRRWAELLRRCSRSRWRCVRTHLRWVPRGGPMRIVGFVTAWASVRRILGHLARRGIEARAGPWAEVAAG
jgi:hypothetical protein